MSDAMITETPFERNRRELRDARERSRALERLANGQRKDVEHAILIDQHATELERARDAYDTDAEFQKRVGDERAAASSHRFLAFLVGLIVVADMFLGTPDVAEQVAAKTQSYIPVSWCQTFTYNGNTLTNPPVWARFAVGAVLVAIFLAVTFATKRLTDETGTRAALQSVEPGDRRRYAGLIAWLWTKRAFKCVYLVVLALLLNLFYQGDLERKRLNGDNGAGFPRIQEERGLTLSDALAEAPVTTAARAGDGAETPAGSSMAHASAVVYAGLWLLHAVMLLMPYGRRASELQFAGFNRARVGTEIQALRAEERTVLGNVVQRIRFAGEDDERDMLILDAAPVARRVNAINGRELLRIDAPQGAGAPLPGDGPAPAGTVDAASPTDAPAPDYDAFFPRPQPT